jgi:hypothetical protein
MYIKQIYKNNKINNYHSYSAFIICLNNNHLECAKFIYDNTEIQNDSLRNIFYYLNNKFLKYCLEDDLDKVKYLYYNFKIDIEYVYKICENNCLNILKFFCEKTSFNYTQALSLSINYLQIENIKFLLEYTKSINKFINIRVINTLIVITCKKLKLDFLKYIFEYCDSINYKIDIHMNDDSMFKLACIYNSLEMVKYLYELSVNINKPFEINEEIYYLCFKNFESNIETIKYILKISKNLNIDNNIAFEINCNIIVLCGSENYDKIIYLIDKTNNLDKYLEIAINSRCDIAITYIKLRQLRINHAKKIIIYFWYNYVLKHIWNPNGRLAKKLMEMSIEEYNNKL